MSSEEANVQTGNPQEEQKTDVVANTTAAATAGGKTANTDVKCLDPLIQVTFQLYLAKNDYCNRNLLPLILLS